MSYISENISYSISRELKHLISGLIQIEDYLQSNPPPQEILQNNLRNINSIDFYLPNFEDEPPIKRRRLDSSSNE